VNLAVTLRLRSEVANAREIDERALEQFRATVQPDHPYAIIATINLASDLAVLGEIEAAVVLDQDAVERGNRVLGVEHPTMLAAALNLSLDLRAPAGTRKRSPTTAHAGPVPAVLVSTSGTIAADQGSAR